MDKFYPSEVTLTGEDFAKLIRDGLIKRGLVPPIGDPIRDKFEWKYSIDTHKNRKGWDRYSVTVYKGVPEPEPEPQKPYEAGDWRDPEISKNYDDSQ
jgi:hypothetical protein